MFPILSGNVASATAVSGNQEGIFAYGFTGTHQSMSNLVSNVGVIGDDVAGVGTARYLNSATEYGGDKGIFGLGQGAGGLTGVTNLVTNAGVIGSDVAAVATARYMPAACGYGDDKGIFGFGNTGSITAVTNLVTNAGVVGSDVAGVGTARTGPEACEYGGDKGIFAYGLATPGWPNFTAVSNLVSNTGVVASDVAGVGPLRYALAACSYGDDKGIFGFGYDGVGDTPSLTAVTNLVSNVGVVSSNVAGVGTARQALAACEYGGDKGIFGYGHYSGTVCSNLVSNTGVVASDVAIVGTSRTPGGACSFN